ncbi:hypothetical protein [Elizabethkingia miricola]|uniref:hypothetical protein n=1 Tax=Elizabethkingia miricola TaxID=172045 RepID=UPI0038915E50
MAVTVLHNQSLLDIAIQATGKAENAIFIAIANKISITDDLEPGIKLKSAIANDNIDIRNYYSVKAIQPATDAKTNIIQYNEGIGWWEIGFDNIVE